MIREIENIPTILTENGLHVICSLASKLPNELRIKIIEKSRQLHIMKFEADEDAGGRFKDLQSFEKWAKKKRVLYLLMDNDELAGIIWFGERTNSKIDARYKLTFGIRLYEGYVGKGLSKPLMKVGHQDIKNYFESRHIWLDLDEKNVAAERAYISYGYKEIIRADGRIIMGIENV